MSEASDVSGERRGSVMGEVSAWTQPTAIADQIAQQIAASIVDGAHQNGDRLLEEDVSALFGVSRTPVREAFQKLARRGLLRVTPRRGAFVIGASVEMVADLFNIRAVLVGLTGRYFARYHTSEQFASYTERAEKLSSYANDPDADPVEVARLAGWAFVPAIEHCQAPALAHLLREQTETSLWGFIWRGKSLDFQTRDRRVAYARDYLAFTRMMQQRKDQDVDAMLRRMMFECRDNVVRALVDLRGGNIDPARCFQDRKSR